MKPFLVTFGRPLRDESPLYRRLDLFRDSNNTSESVSLSDKFPFEETETKKKFYYFSFFKKLST